MTGQPPGPPPVHPLLNAPPNKRTTVQVQLRQDPWPLIAGWAQQHKLVQAGPPMDGLVVFNRTYNQQHVAFLVQGTVLVVQAWISISMMMRIRSLFILPSEIHIGSGGMRAAIGRKALRKIVNELLGHLGAPPIP